MLIMVTHLYVDKYSNLVSLLENLLLPTFRRTKKSKYIQPMTASDRNALLTQASYRYRKEYSLSLRSFQLALGISYSEVSQFCWAYIFEMPIAVRAQARFGLVPSRVYFMIPVLCMYIRLYLIRGIPNKGYVSKHNQQQTLTIRKIPATTNRDDNTQKRKDNRQQQRNKPKIEIVKNKKQKILQKKK